MNALGRENALLVGSANAKKDLLEKTALKHLLNRIQAKGNCLKINQADK